jgi:integrase
MTPSTSISKRERILGGLWGSLAGDALGVPSRGGSPLNLNNWRNRTFNPAAQAAGVGWATPYTGRHTYCSLQIHAGTSPVIVAVLAGNSPEVIWKHYAREFDRSRTTDPVPLETAPRAAREQVARSDVPKLFPSAQPVDLAV